MVKRSKEYVENELNEIFKLIVIGIPDSEIRKLRNLPDRSYCTYKQKLEQRLQERNMNQKTEQVLFHKEVTRERIEKDRRIFQQVMAKESASDKMKVEAARADLEANVVLFKSENETSMFVNTIRGQQTDVLRLNPIATNLQPVEEP